MRQEDEAIAELAAKKAVEKTFAILGFNVNEPSEVEDFRRDLRFAGDLRRMAGKSIATFLAALVTAIAVTMWHGVGK